MAVRQYKEYKPLSPRKKRISKKKQRKRNKIKQAFHNLFSFLMLIFIFPALYFLIWGLIIEPNLPRHIYGPGDLKEFIYLMISILIISLSYFFILIINYKPLNMVWWENIKLFISVGFSFDKYTAMKRMGIKYNRAKKRRQHYYSSDATEHKSITQ
jgi:hypothetical protein